MNQRLTSSVTASPELRHARISLERVRYLARFLNISHEQTRAIGQSAPRISLLVIRDTAQACGTVEPRLCSGNAVMDAILPFPCHSLESSTYKHSVRGDRAVPACAPSTCRSFSGWRAQMQRIRAHDCPQVGDLADSFAMARRLCLK
jgi:hypothetical protein